MWITIRRIKPGTYDEFSRAWRPSEFPAGMLRAFEPQRTIRSVLRTSS